MNNLPDLESKRVDIKPDSSLIDRIPAAYALKFEAVPCCVDGGGRFLVVSTETPQEIIDEMMRITEIWAFETRPREEVRQLIDKAYESLPEQGDTPEETGEAAISGLDPSARIEITPRAHDSHDEGHMIKFVNAMLSRAIGLKATDIHLEPHEHEFGVRKRINGVLNSAANLPRELHEPVVSRIKIMAGLDTAEKDVPQEGKFRVRLAGKELNVRVSTVPTSFGERAVLRVKTRSGVLEDAAQFFRNLFTEDAPRRTHDDAYGLDGEGAGERDDIPTPAEHHDPSVYGDLTAPPAPPESADPDTPDEPNDRVVSRIVQKNIFRSRYPDSADQKSAALLPVKEMLRKWDCQEVPASLFDFASFRERYGTRGALEVLIGIEEERMKHPLPKVSSVSTGYMVGGKLPRVDFDVVAFGFRNREYTEESLVIWAADYFPGASLSREKLEHFENRCRLLSLEKSLSADQLVKWAIFEGKVDSATLSFAASCGILLSHTKQMKILFNLFDIDHAPEGELTWDLDFEESSGTVGGFAIKAQKPDKEGSDR